MAEPNFLNFADISHNAYQAGRQRAREEGVRNALQSYTDKPLEAENALVGYGDFETANALRQRRMSDEAMKRKQGYAETAKAQGYSAAREAAVMAGDEELAAQYGKLDDNQRARAKEALGLTAKIGEQIKKVIPMGQDPNATIQQRRAQVLDLADDIKAMTGVVLTPDQINTMDLSDKGIDSFVAQARALGAYEQPKLQTVNRGNGGYDVVNLENGDVVRGVDPYPLPQYEKITDPNTGVTTIVELPRAPGGMSSSQGVRGATALPNMNGNMAEDFINTLVPGARITSRKRTVAQNDKADGVENSMHLDDMARDFVPPPGTDRPALVQKLKASGNFSEVLDEGDHIHVGWRQKGNQAPAGPRAVFQTAGYEGGVSPKEAKETKKDAINLRKEFDALPEVKQFNKVATQLSQVRQAASAPSAQNDIALIFSYMKMLDPDSVVREGEFATAQNAAGVPDQVRNLFNKALSGQRLNNDQRAGLVRSAEGQYQAYASRYDEIAQQYEGYERDMGLPDTTIQPRKRDEGQGGGAKSGFNWTQPQLQAAQRYRGSKAPVGSAQNPVAVASEAAANAKPKGTYVILPNGAVGVVE